MSITFAKRLQVFLPFALGYFLSYLYRVINSVLAPNLAGDIGVDPSELGLLTAAYFITFGVFQLPLGVLLDRFGPRRIEAALFKKRIAMPGQGKRGGWRSFLAFQMGNKAFFLYLFPKNRQESIDAAELKALKRLSRYYLTLKPAEIKTATQCGELREVTYNEKSI